MDTIAEQYVKLVLALGQHDADYVDAYYGPPERKKEGAVRRWCWTTSAPRAKTLLPNLAGSAGSADPKKPVRTTR